MHHFEVKRAKIRVLQLVLNCRSFHSVVAFLFDRFYSSRVPIQCTKKQYVSQADKSTVRVTSVFHIKDTGLWHLRCVAGWIFWSTQLFICNHYVLIIIHSSMQWRCYMHCLHRYLLDNLEIKQIDKQTNKIMAVPTMWLIRNEFSIKLGRYTFSNIWYVREQYIPVRVQRVFSLLSIHY